MNIRQLSLTIAFAVLSSVPVSVSHAQDMGIATGSPAPTAKLKATDGREIDLATVIGTKTVVLEFWATWCPNCKALEPKLIEAQRKYRDSVAIYIVAVPINQNLDRVTRYAQQYRYPFPVLWDGDGEYAASYDVPATSFIAVVDRAGKVVYTGLGADQDIDAAIRKGLQSGG